MPRRDAGRSRSRTRSRDRRQEAQDSREILQMWARASVDLNERHTAALERLSAVNVARVGERRVPTFDGTRSWTVFAAQFDSATESLSPEARGRRLLESLQGRAADLIQTLPPADYTNYDRLCERLREHYDPAQRQVVAEAELDRRVQKSGESLTDFGAEILRLAREAYPRWLETELQTVAKKAFLNGIADPEVRRAVRFSRPANYGDALSAAINAEHVETVDPSGKRPRISQVREGTADNAVADQLQAVLDNMLHLLETSSGATSSGLA